MKSHQVIAIILLFTFSISLGINLVFAKNDPCFSVHDNCQVDTKTESNRIVKQLLFSFLEKTHSEHQQNPCDEGQCHFGHCSHMMSPAAQFKSLADQGEVASFYYLARQLNRPLSTLFRPPIA